MRRTPPPAALGALLGRETLLTRLTSDLRRERLVTLTGTGGVGKTRLAVDLVTRVAHAPAWTDLQPVRDADRVAPVVAAALGLRERDDHDAIEEIVALAGRGPTTIVLDTCEHLAGAVAQLASRLLARCASLTVLTTSRTPLGVTGEHVVEVPPLPAPTAPDPTAAQLRAAAATALFLVRASTFDVDRVTADDRRAVATICRRLDGVPLAIELAAARVPSISPSELLDALDDRFPVLTGGAGHRPDRQRTLEASIGWSYELLDPPARRALRRLAVFPAGFDADALREIGHVTRGSDGVDTIASLVHSGLLRVGDAPHHGRRYRLLESVRAFLVERLVDAGEWDAVRDDHLTLVVDRLATLADSRAADSITSPASWVFQELHDVRAAARWAAASDQHEQVVRLWWPLHLVLSLHEHGRDPYAAAAAIPDDAPLSPAAARRRAVIRAAGPGRHTAGAHALRDARQLVARMREDPATDPFELFCALGALATHRAWAAEPKAELGRELIALVDEHGQRWGPLATAALGPWATRMLDLAGVPAESYPVAMAAAEAARVLRSAPLEGICHARAAAAALRLGLDTTQIGEHTDRMVALLPRGWGGLHLWLLATVVGGLHLSRGDGAGLRARLAEAAETATDDAGRTALAYGHLLASMAAGDATRAVADASALLATLGHDASGWLADAVRVDLAESLRAAGRTAEARAAVMRAEDGLSDTADVLVRIVLSGTIGALAVDDDPVAALEQLTADATAFLQIQHRSWIHLQLLPAARALVTLGCHEEAATVLGAIAGELEARGQRIWGIHRPEHDQALEACRSALGDEGHRTAFEGGRRLTWDDCVALVASRVRARSARVTTSIDRLTPAEQEVARIAAAGETVAAIAAQLHVSPNTVKTHLRHVYRKLEVSNRVTLAAVVARHQHDEPG